MGSATSDPEGYAPTSQAPAADLPTAIIALQA